ncbi:MAG: DEAD/DEAH box helicase [Patescibacteria group bacterium]
MAFLLPLLNQIDSNIVKPQALILAPTRELVVQTYDEIYKLTNYYRVPTCCVY